MHKVIKVLEARLMVKPLLPWNHEEREKRFKEIDEKLQILAELRS